MKIKTVLQTLASAAVLSVGLVAGSANATVVSFGYTGNVQAFVVPFAVTNIHLEAWGAQGYSTGQNQGGLGGYTSGDYAVNAGDTLYVFVGGAGTVANLVNVLQGGGYNGGGDGVTWGGANVAGGGGGATDFRVGGQSFADRILVAGGGGGATGNTPANGGAGGGAVGGSAIAWSGYVGGSGGTQVAGGGTGGSFGLGGDALIGQTGWVGGGGGGWFGGGASPAHFGGGGGSSYIGGVSNGQMLQGVNTSNGFARFTFTANEVPEPGTFALAGLALVGLALRRRKVTQA